MMATRALDVALDIAASRGVVRGWQSILYDVAATDPSVLAVAAFICAIGLLVPCVALRLSVEGTADPMTALRYELI